MQDIVTDELVLNAPLEVGPFFYVLSTAGVFLNRVPIVATIKEHQSLAEGSSAANKVLIVLVIVCIAKKQIIIKKHNIIAGCFGLTFVFLIDARRVKSRKFCCSLDASSAFVDLI